MNYHQPSIVQRLVFISIGALFLFTENSCKQNEDIACMDKSPVTVNDTINTKTLIAIKQAEKLLKNAALVTRSDNDFESLALQNFSKREQSYSHSGLAFLEDGRYVVYHAM